MPRGVYERKKKIKVSQETYVSQVPIETDEEIAQRIMDRFEVMEDMTRAAVNGDTRSLIISGPAGLGKSFTVESILEQSGSSQEIIKGYICAPALYKMLYRQRHRGCVLAFDDCDKIILDEVGVNLLKAACDTTDERMISYMVQGDIIDEETGEGIPKKFLFEGTVIIITNLDMDAMVERGHKLAPHLTAIISRTHYIDLSMKTTRDYLIRIRQVVKGGMLRDRGLEQHEEDEVMEYVNQNFSRLREMSLRMVIKISNNRAAHPTKWRKVCDVTCCR